MSAVEIPYQSDSARYYARLRDLPRPVWLDSGRPATQAGRYDILTADPPTYLITQGSHTTITDAGGKRVSEANPFALLEAALARLSPGADSALPFSGGALGYFGYELNTHLEAIAPRGRNERPTLPEMAVGIYDWGLVVDHAQRRAWLNFLPTCPAPRRAALCRCLEAASETAWKENKDFKVNRLNYTFNVDSYLAKVDRILDYIRAGDCYQVNFAQQFSARYVGDPFVAYRVLREVSPASYSAFMEFPGGAVLCHSPEQFVEVRRGRARSRPIKGTRPRAAEPARDRALAAELLASAKDRAENLMIVDLLRNDLSKNCRTHSVKVPALFELESFANVHHLVSTVSGHLKAGASPVQVLRDCFPGGSITGAPKIRAMEIIRELEPVARSVYCGSIGYIGADGAMDTNIAIRTLVCDRESIYCWGGGGIVADSTPAAEYEESLAKVRNLLEALAQFQV